MALRLNHSRVRLIQFADLHLGESDADERTMALMRSVLTHHRPDLVVFTGDQVTGYEVFYESQRRALWAHALSEAAGQGIPFVTLFGNHDDQPYRMDPMLWNGLAAYALVAAMLGALCRTGRRMVGLWLLCAMLTLVLVYTAPSGATRRALLRHERTVYPTLSYTGPHEVVIETPRGSVGLVCIDSGGGMLPAGIHYYSNRRRQRPAVAFMHIPPLGFGDAPQQREPVSACPGTERLLPALAESGVKALFVGHDHGNSWCRTEGGMLLCYGKHSGFGGYDFEENGRGARLIELSVENASFITVETRLVLYDDTARRTA